MTAHHYEGDDLIVRKIRVGDLENNVYVLEDPATHDALLVDNEDEALAEIGADRTVVDERRAVAAGAHELDARE